MHIILTHEQADFDAVASLLAAHLLCEPTVPVLPRRMNRNLQAFLALYGSELPFTDPNELKGDLIHDITLVDTQSLVTLKGMSKRTKVHVVDHHQERPDLPSHWDISIEPVGACTTIFVEHLQSVGINLTPLQATLLLLGIYEDTGSLSYPGTTSRDIRSAAFLLEEGAILKMAARYLNPPLSDEQRNVYDRLLGSCQTYQVHGHKIIVSCAQAEDLSEEVSSIAHKLRDLLDPDALFLFIRTSDGIRMVARSTSDQIDVSEIAAHFGGGGHSRAAAALIKSGTEKNNPEKLEDICTHLVDHLQNSIQPQITVKKIMSRQPHLISPTTSLDEAAALMRRYGYEGYPVVDGFAIKGLLTRRAVDRALSHKLNLNAGSLMEAGNHFVTPEQSLQDLQQLMMETGWGQIPVVDPVTHEITGIVTRTDLLKILSNGEKDIKGRLNIKSRLIDALPLARLALLKAVASHAKDLRYPVFIVGGFVRDLLLDRPSMDFDVVVEGDAITLGQKLGSIYGGKVTSHSRFGTAKWHISEIKDSIINQLNGTLAIDPEELPDNLDLISARTEFYDHPTALPTVERGSIKLDLHRRDFSINTLALRLDGHHCGELYDFWGGYRDLERKLVRVLHSLSFVDDPTRMLRAVRFEQRFGFTIEERTLQLIREALPMLRQVSGSRIRHELDLILLEENACQMLSRLNQLDLLSPIHPLLAWKEILEKPMRAALQDPISPEWGLDNEFGTLPTRLALGYLVWLQDNQQVTARNMSEVLHFPSNLRSALEITCKLRAEFTDFAGLPPSMIVKQLERASSPVLFALFQRGDNITRSFIWQYITHWQNIEPRTTGSTLQQMGVKPGKIYSLILSGLRDAWLDGLIHSEKDEEILLNKFITELGKG